MRFTKVGNSLVKGDGEGRGLGLSPEPSRRGPTAPHGVVGVGSKLLDPAQRDRKGRGWAVPSSLDYNKHNCNTSCGRLSVTGPAKVAGKKAYAYARLKCKSWNCPECGPLKAWKLQKAIEKEAGAYDLTRLLTLTLDPKTIPDDVDDTKYIRQIWRKFRVYLTRKLGKSASYITILEFHRSGRPHLHVLVNRYISQPWISESWEALGGGRICHIERVSDIHRLANYLSKYLTKAMILSAPPGTRRYTTSRDIRLFEKIVVFGWSLADRTIEELFYLASLNLLTETFDRDGSIRYFTTRTNLETAC